MPYVLLLFVIMPIVEIALLLKVGDAIGWLLTLGIVILTAILGTTMLRQQGIATLAAARARLDAGEVPAWQLLEGVLLLIGGVLLLTPGFVTDAFGFICLLPPTRRWLAQRIAARSLISVGSFGGLGRGSADGGVGGRPGGFGAPHNSGDARSGSGSTTVGSGQSDGARKSASSRTTVVIDELGGRPQPSDSVSDRSRGGAED
jgi:UPF0716 protein FxsA